VLSKRQKCYTQGDFRGHSQAVGPFVPPAGFSPLGSVVAGWVIARKPHRARSAQEEKDEPSEVKKEWICPAHEVKCLDKKWELIMGVLTASVLSLRVRQSARTRVKRQMSRADRQVADYAARFDKNSLHKLRVRWKPQETVTATTIYNGDKIDSGRTVAVGYLCVTPRSCISCTPT
jgi:hypothetical protein